MKKEAPLKCKGLKMSSDEKRGTPRTQGAKEKDLRRHQQKSAASGNMTHLV
jgi:hypothetical protein